MSANKRDKEKMDLYVNNASEKLGGAATVLFMMGIPLEAVQASINEIYKHVLVQRKELEAIANGKKES